METATRKNLDRMIRGKLEECLAMAIEEAGDDQCVLRMPVGGNALNAIARVHGGAISALIDTAATGAAWACDGFSKSARGATVSLTVNFMAGAKGAMLFADAKVKRRGRSIVFLEVDVTDSAGTVIAQGLVSYKLDLNNE